MPGKSGISASELARNYGVSLNEFTDEVLALLARLERDAPAERVLAHRREVCAAVSAAMTFALDASTLSAEERDKLDPLLREVLLPFWNRHCASEQGAAEYIAARQSFYLAHRVAGSQVRTAVSIVTLLAGALDLPADQKDQLIRSLSPAFAHRMVSDVYRLNDLRAKFGVQLSMLGLLCTLLEVSMSCESILRVLGAR
jgi:hypothetical protein